MRKILLILLLSSLHCFAQSYVDIDVQYDGFLSNSGLGSARDYNYGNCSSVQTIGSNFAYVGGWSQDTIQAMIPAGAIVSAGTLFVYTTYGFSDATLNAYLTEKPLKYQGNNCGTVADSAEMNCKNWFSGGSGEDSNWAAFFLANADDGGSWNRSDSTDADRFSTAMGSVLSTGTAYFPIPASVTAIQQALDGGRDEFGVMITASASVKLGDQIVIYPGEYLFPNYLRIYYTEASGNNRELRGGKHSTGSRYDGN